MHHTVLATHSSSNILITSYEQPVGPLFLKHQVNASDSVFGLKDQVIYVQFCIFCYFKFNIESENITGWEHFLVGLL